MSERDQRIREHAYRIWEEEGRPHGRDKIHWDMASELVAIEDNQKLATKPNPIAEGETRSFYGEPIEPVKEAVENLGEFPTMTDQGEEQSYPSKRRGGGSGKTDASKTGATKTGDTRTRTRSK